MRASPCWPGMAFSSWVAQLGRYTSAPSLWSSAANARGTYALQALRRNRHCRRVISATWRSPMAKASSASGGHGPGRAPPGSDPARLTSGSYGCSAWVFSFGWGAGFPKLRGFSWRGARLWKLCGRLVRGFSENARLGAVERTFVETLRLPDPAGPPSSCGARPARPRGARLGCLASAGPRVFRKRAALSGGAHVCGNSAVGWGTGFPKTRSSGRLSARLWKLCGCPTPQGRLALAAPGQRGLDLTDALGEAGLVHGPFLRLELQGHCLVGCRQGVRLAWSEDLVRVSSPRGRPAARRASFIASGMSSSSGTQRQASPAAAASGPSSTSPHSTNAAAPCGPMRSASRYRWPPPGWIPTSSQRGSKRAPGRGQDDVAGERKVDPRADGGCVLTAAIVGIGYGGERGEARV